MTFAASANAIAYTGASPVFVDSLLSDGNVDPDLLFTALDTLRSEGVCVAAVMTVDLFGRCADYTAIRDRLNERNIPLVEDAAEAFGARLGGQNAGSFGDASVISFNGNKIMTTSGGGMLLSDNVELIRRCRHLSTQARQPTPYYEHIEIGYNYRLSNILAALGRGQLTRLDSMIERRRSVRRAYVRGLSDLPGVRFLGHQDYPDEFDDNCWLTSIVLDPGVAPISAESLIKSLATDDIEARHLWKPMHLQPVFVDARAFVNGASEHLFNNGVTLPSGSALTDAEIDRVIGSVRSAFGQGES